MTTPAAANPLVLVPACNRMLGEHPFHIAGKKYLDAVRLAGAKTRAAVKDMQIKLGLPADSYATPELLYAVTGFSVHRGALASFHRGPLRGLDEVLGGVLVAGEELVLPARELEVLWELMTPPGRTVSKKDLSNKLSDFDDALADNALEAFISRLRKKLAQSGASIRTLRGIGYLMEEERA